VHQVIYGRHMYVVPRPDGETLIGATVEDMGFRKEVTLEGLEELIQAGRRIAPGIMGQSVVRTWAGRRSPGPTAGRSRSGRSAAAPRTGST
jgi:glycine/D-amino acid oxidase-like deaminating enzyme